MDKQMNRLVNLGILSANNTSHTSPVMLITRKVTQDKRPMVDFRLLNTHIRRRNTATPLMSDIYNILGKSRCEVMSCVDIKDAFHSIHLNERSKEFCGILPYFGSTHYCYEVLPMGLAISPAAWLMYVNMLLDTFGKYKRSFIAIMDNLLIHSSKEKHFLLIQLLLEDLCKHGLKLSPKKSQLFRTELVYMGNTFSIHHQRMTICPLWTQIEAILNYPRPQTIKDCKSFCCVVNYLSFFCKDLQRLLSPIYHLTKQDVPFKWTVHQEKSFNEIKRRLCSSFVLSLPISGGRFIMYSDTSRTHAGSALWQIQDGKPCLLGYASKTLPAASKNYSVTELEMTGMLINLHSWCNYIHGIEIDVAVDHKAMVQIMKAKHPPCSDWVSVLLGKLLDKPFDLYYVKGKDLLLADFLSRIKTDRSDPGEVIPISFINERQSLGDLTYHLNSGRVMRSAAIHKGLSMPTIHGHSKQLDPHCKPEHQAKITPATTHPSTTQRARPRMDPSSTSVQKHTPVSFTTSRKLIKRSIKTLNKDSPQSSIDHKIPPSPVPIVPQFDPLTGSKDPPFVPATPNHVEPAPVKEGNEQPHTEEPQLGPPSYAPVTGEMVPGQPIDPDLDIGGPLPNYHDQAEVVVRRPLQEELDAPIPLHKLVDTSKISQRRLPRQSEIDPILKEIETKILRQVHLPTSSGPTRSLSK